MKIQVKPNLAIKKSDNSWDVVRTFVTKREDGTEGERDNITYHGTLAQALQKVCDLELADGGLTTDLSLVHRKVAELMAEMHTLAERIETSLVLQI